MDEHAIRREQRELVKRKILRDYQLGRGPALGSVSPNEFKRRVDEAVEVEKKRLGLDEVEVTVEVEAEVEGVKTEEEVVPGTIIESEVVESEVEESDESETETVEAAEEVVEEEPKEATPKLSAKETIALIKAAESVDEVLLVLGDDDRKTVQEAAQSRIGQLAEDKE